MTRLTLNAFLPALENNVEKLTWAVSLCHCLVFLLSKSVFGIVFLYFPSITLCLSLQLPYILSFTDHLYLPSFPNQYSVLAVLSQSSLPSLLLSWQVFWGQEHLNCLKLVEEHLQVYLNLQKKDSADSCSKGKACHTQPPPSPGSPSPRTEHSSDDLRTGNFQYLQDSGECLHCTC